MASRALRCTWRSVLAAGGAAPAARSSHSVTAVGGKVCVFGGEDKPRNAFDASLHVLGRDGAWARTGAPLPSGPVLGHGAAGLGSRLIVFGGRTGGPNDFGGQGADGETEELRIFDMEEGVWTTKSSSSSGGSSPWPAPRSFHAMCAADGQVYVFGGCGVNGRLNDLWRLDVESGSWTCLHPGGTDSNTAPTPRGGASLIPGMQSLVLIFGFDGTQRGDVAVFDLGKGKWEVVPQEGQGGDVPTPRSVFCAAELGIGRALVFGGEVEASALGHEGAGHFTDDLFVLDTGSLTWTKLCPEGEAPRPRGWTGQACVEQDRVVLFGGLDDNNERLGDTWELLMA